jgi:hypothetical protein
MRYRLSIPPEYRDNAYTFKLTLIKGTNLENEMSLSASEVDISGDDSQKALLPSRDRSGKPELENFSFLAFGADMGVELSRRMFPSEKDLLINDLKNKFYSYQVSCIGMCFNNNNNCKLQHLK